jgi:hypothetical protein
MAHGIPRLRYLSTRCSAMNCSRRMAHTHVSDPPSVVCSHMSSVDMMLCTEEAQQIKQMMHRWAQQTCLADNIRVGPPNSSHECVCPAVDQRSWHHQQLLQHGICTRRESRLWVHAVIAPGSRDSGRQQATLEIALLMAAGRHVSLTSARSQGSQAEPFTCSG